MGRRWAWLVAVGLGSCGDTINNGDVTQPWTVLASVSSTGTQGNSGSQASFLSSNGRFLVFTSDAATLVPGDANGAADVFVRDLDLGTTVRVSVSSGGQEGNDSCGGGAISADGRYVAFVSSATNLVGPSDEGGADTNNQGDVYVRDLREGKTRRVSLDSNEAQAVGESGSPGISDDGRYVVFTSDANNLVPGDTAGTDLFVRDTVAGTTTRVSLTAAGGQVNGTTWSGVISGDGKIVAFSSTGSNIHPDDSDATTDVFVRDWSSPSPTTVLVSRASGASLPGSVKGNGASLDPALSWDGSIVAFASTATNLVSGDTNGVTDIFVRDWRAASPTTRRISVSSSAKQATGTSSSPRLSGDGRYVVFTSGAANLVAGDLNGSDDVFRHNLTTLATERVSVATYGDEATFGGEGAFVSLDGRSVAFTSGSANLVPMDFNGRGDVFVRRGLRD